MKTNRLTTILLILAFLLTPQIMSAKKPKSFHDKQKEKQWRSMENGPWDFAPDWYYYFLHRKYSGAEMYWKWAGFKSGYRVRFKEDKSNVKRIMPVRVTAEETQRQKLSQAEKERAYIEELYKEELVREADRIVDLTYSAYKEEFNRMQDCISDGLLYCLQKSNGELQYQVDEISRVNEVLCYDIAYIHKTGPGYELENAKRQQAYEDAKKRMEDLVSRTALLCAVAATNY